MSKIGRAVDVARREGVGPLARKAWEYHLRPRRLYWNLRSGTNVYERDWDLLLVLDACRVDALQEVADEFDFLPESIPAVVSVGQGSPHWMANTFTPAFRGEQRQTAYLSANPYTRMTLGSPHDGRHAEVGGLDVLDEFADFVPVWEVAWDESRGTVPARAVTDRLVRYGRSARADRVIAHYIQPHFPSVPDPLGARLDLDDEGRWVDSVWERLERGELDVDRAWESYVENLRYVLEDVRVVLENYETDRVVITADHGNAFGEHGDWGHGATDNGTIMRVPWVELSGTDGGEYVPDVSPVEATADHTSVEEKLEALGYV
jgi:hypothetical protein